MSAVDLKPSGGFGNYLKMGEAAAFLGVHPDTLRRWDREGRVACYRHPVNRYRLFLKEELRELLGRIQTP